MRGAEGAPNYDTLAFQQAENSLVTRRLNPRIMIDCNHGNSQKNHTTQLSIIKQLASRITVKTHAPFGVMLESYLIAGKQQLSQTRPLTYGQSITDACLGWADTELALAILDNAVRQSRQQKSTKSTTAKHLKIC